MSVNSTDAVVVKPVVVDNAVTKLPIKEVKSDNDVPIKKIQAQNRFYQTKAEKKELPVSEKIMLEAIEKANRAIEGVNRKLEFQIHEKTKEVMVKVVDTDTNQVIREIPSEKILDMVAKMWEMAGIIVDERR